VVDGVQYTPFRYHKSWVHEGGVASPLIVHWPAGIRARGELRHTPSHFVDIVPTMIEWAGQEVDPGWKGRDSPPLAGVSLAPAILEGHEPERDFIFFRHIGHRALRMGKWKMVAVARGRWELYDMESDRSELRNLAHKHPGRVKRMARIWERAHKTFVEQVGETRD
jgi:arylsulfatase